MKKEDKEVHVDFQLHIYMNNILSQSGGKL